MQNHIEELMKWQKETLDIIDVESKNINNVLDPIVRDWQMNTIPNIEASFGNFLISSLGDNISSVRSYVINMDLLKNQYPHIINGATQNNISVEQFLKEKDVSYHWDGRNIYKKTPAYISTGNTFGVSYMVGTTTDSRMHTMSFDKNNIFYYLTQAHVDGIKNKEKRECAQAFYDFKVEFINNSSILNPVYLDTNVNINALKIETIMSKPMFYSGYRPDNSSYITCISKREVLINKVVIASNPHRIWMMDTLPRCSNMCRPDDSPCVSIMYFHNNGNKSELFGTVELNRSSQNNSVNKTNYKSAGTIIDHSLACPSSLESNIRNSISNTVKENFDNPSELGINIENIIMEPQVMSEITKRIDFYKKYSTRLQELKHEYSALYFVNSH